MELGGFCLCPELLLQPDGQVDPTARWKLAVQVLLQLPLPEGP